MGSTRRTRSRKLSLEKGGSLRIVSDCERIVIQFSRPPKDRTDPMEPALTAGMELTGTEALALAGELLTALLAGRRTGELKIASDCEYTGPA